MKMIKFTSKLFLILAASLLPTGVWADDVINVTQASDFGATTTDYYSAYYTLEDGKTYNLTATIELQGYLLIPSGATITINLGDFDLDQKRSNCCVILNRGTLILNGTGNIKGGHGHYSSGFMGGGIENLGILNISGVTICDNRGDSRGGGINNGTTGEVTINSGCISNNTEGAIYNQGTMTIKGGSIENHAVAGDSPCIANTGTLIIEGGSITGNTVGNKNTGCLINDAGANLTIKGNPVIKNNTTQGGAYLRNIYLRTGTTITIGEGGLTGDDGDIGITMQTPSVFTSVLINETDLNKFFSDDDAYEIVKSLDNKAKLRTLWDGLIERFAAGGAIELDKDYTAASGELCLTVPDGKTVTLNLNGHTISRGLSTATDDGCVIKNIGTLTVNGTGIITGGKSSNGGGGIHNTGTLTVNGGSIRGNTTTTQGGGIYNAGILTIGGGTIENNSNTTGDGGGIYNSGSLTLNTGTISGNSVTGTSKNGGGIYNTGTLLEINGGTIQNNTATNAGGGIYHDGTTFNLQGSPLITGNTVNSNAGNVYLTSDHHTITITNALGYTTPIGVTMEAPAAFTSGLSGYGTYEKFSSEQSSTIKLTENGDHDAEMMTYWNYLKRELAKDGVTSVTLESGKTYQASSTDTYLHIPSTKTVTLNLNGQTINRKLNSATLNGCVIYNEGTLTITGSGIIRGGNNSDGGVVKGGGICNTGTLSIQGGTIQNNTTYSSGGGIYNTGTLTIQGGTITSNTATSASGGIYHNGVALYLQGAPTISGNTVSSANNNLYLATDKTITVSGPLTNSTAIGITSQVYPWTFTTGLSGNGDKSKFTADDGIHGIALNSAGNAIIGTKYTITRNEPNGDVTYMYINGDYTSNTIEAVAGERIKVTLSGDGYYHTIPVSLSYTDGTLSTYPKGGEEYGFDMPDHDVTVTGVCWPGGYCGASGNEEKMKYYLNTGCLTFVTENDVNCDMETYTSSTIPWRTMSYTSISLSDHVTSISPYAFYGSSLASADIPTSIATIGTFAFSNCTSLTAINVNPSNTNYISSDGVLYTKSTGNPTNLVCYPAGKSDESYSVPSTVTTITDGAFAFETHLTSITVAGGSSFKGVNGVLFSNDGATLYHYPAGNTSTKYTIPSDVTAIAPYAFHKCSSLQYVYDLRSIGVPTGGTAMFDNTSCKIMVNKDLLAAYKAADFWSTYQSRIYKIDLSDAIITLTSNDDDYDIVTIGTPVEPSVTSVRSNAGDNLTLTRDVDYTIAWSGNTAVGTGTVTITGIGNYEGTNGTENFNVTRKVVLNVSGDYATYFAAENLKLPNNFTASVITDIDWSNQTLTTAAVTYIPANKPVILNRAHLSINGTYHLKAATSTPAVTYDDTHFKGVLDATDYADLKTSGVRDIYTLKGNCFYRATGGTLPANRCYILYLSTDPDYVPSPSRLPLDDDGTTSIDSIENGNLKIENDKYYDLNGRRVLYPTKGGIYIYNGKKIIIK